MLWFERLNKIQGFQMVITRMPKRVISRRHYGSPLHTLSSRSKESCQSIKSNKTLIWIPTRAGRKPAKATFDNISKYNLLTNP